MSDNGLEERAWPEAVVGLAEATDWISAVLPGQPTVTGPRKIYAVYADEPDRRVTARFSVGDSPTMDVTFKAVFFALLHSSPSAHALVARCCPGNVPEVLAWEERPGGSFLIYRAFDGQTLEDLHSLDALCDMARTLARIQTAAAASPGAQTTPLPRVGTDDIPRLFDQVLQTLQTHARAWEHDDGTLAQWLPFPPSAALLWMETLRPQVERWAADITAGPWPLTVCHRDLHAGNAVR